MRTHQKTVKAPLVKSLVPFRSHVYSVKNNIHWQNVRNQPSKGIIKFVEGKGLCSSCLTQGHLSKDCKKRALCEDCSKKHPSMLHVTREEDNEVVKSSEKSTTENMTACETTHNSSGPCCATRAGKDSCVLATVPVCVTVKESKRVIETYTFMDNGSQATLCTEKLMRQLGIERKKTQILLRSMGQKKLEPSYSLSGLEICGLKENMHIDLPEIYTHEDIPVSKENIPVQEDLKEWPHLHGIELPQIKVDVGLLIGCDGYKAMEPWEIIHSADDGPYTVRTILGWVINGSRLAVKTVTTLQDYIIC